MNLIHRYVQWRLPVVLWVDYFEWQSLDDALAAAKRFKQAPETREFNDAIESGSVVMRHLITRHLAN